MPSANRRIAVGKRELEPVVTRLSSIYQQTIVPGDENDGDAFCHESAAVWCIGETLAACGGYDLMWLVFREVEEASGPDCAAWLDRAWHGIAIPGVVLWSATHSDQSQA